MDDTIWLNTGFNDRVYFTTTEEGVRNFCSMVNIPYERIETDGVCINAKHKRRLYVLVYVPQKFYHIDVTRAYALIVHELTHAYQRSHTVLEYMTNSEHMALFMQRCTREVFQHYQTMCERNKDPQK